MTLEEYLPYTGVGSRETPEDVLGLMESIGYLLARDGWTLRSGGAEGADSAFERGAMRGMDGELLEPWPEIFLPWSGFNNRPLGPDFVEPQAEAFQVAAKYHPAWDRLSQGGRRLHARNVHQVLGSDLDKPIKSGFVICWTKGGKGGGGTGQAIRIAEAHDVPIEDLGREEVLQSWTKWVAEREDR
ncbi:MAG: hypothetical protein KGL39_24985 [Patescibacteria group bacterium]|nr:hypothetical protein [Patescibacteria group bacterium]